MLHDPDVYVLSRALHTAMTMTASERHFGKTVETLYNQRAWLVMMAILMSRIWKHRRI